MKITTLIENRVSKQGLVAEHGLSFFIEHPQANILVDTGQGDNFARNARQLGIDISSVDYLIITHGHNDHTGGLAHFIENNNQAKILLKEETLWPKFKNDKYIGFNKLINTNSSRFQFIDKQTEIVKGLFIMPETTSFFPVDTHFENFFTQKNGQRIADHFNDELFIVFQNEEALTVLSSCSHNGITNMCETAEKQFKKSVQTVLGGFHIKDTDSSIVNHIAAYFNERSIKNIHTCHCTGVSQFVELKSKCDGVVNYNETGSILELEKKIV
jgi:7,8-dihydropterin-6-yl-methyl-4-(beta-D-ribofuranosyl)aminobenzene 5'-phosphate synthase